MVLHKVKQALDAPELVAPFIHDHYETMQEFWSNGEYLKIGDYLYSSIGGRSFYVPLYYWKTRSTVLEQDVLGNKLLYPLSDSGIGYELLMSGEREQKAAEIFRQQLQRIDGEVEELTVIEAGANIGYYLLQEADILDANSHILAFEPVPDNVHFLRKNIRRNGIGDMVSLAPIAVGSERSRVEMNVKTESNWASVTEEGGDDTVPVESWPLDAYLPENGHATDSVNVVRMDVEGYEFQVLQGMTEIIEESSPLLLFMELHASNLRDKGDLKPLLGFLRENGFELRSAVRRRKSLNINSIDELHTVKGAPNTFLVKEE